MGEVKRSSWGKLEQLEEAEGQRHGMRRVGEGEVERLQKPEKGLDYHSTTVWSEEMLQETLLTVFSK